MGVADMQQRKLKIFEISFRKDQRNEMFEYLRNVRRQNGVMVSFNGLGFDEPVLQQLLKNKTMVVVDIYDHAMKVIASGYGGNKWQYQIRDKDRLLQQLDLFKLNHFDNKAKATSLKMTEFNSRSANIADLPFPVGKHLTGAEIDVLIKYCCHDVKETVKFFEECEKLINFRIDLGAKYGMNALNWNDTKIGSEFFIMELEKAGIACYDEQGKARKTKRQFIDLSECIFPYIKFERPEFNAILEWIRKQRISQTKGVFSDIPEHELGDVAKYAEMTTKRIKFKGVPTQKEIDELLSQYPLGWVEEVELKAKLPKKDGGGFKKAYWFNYRIADSLNVVIDGLCYVSGTGGAHASVTNQVILADDEWMIVDIDITSMYPSLAIKNRVYPAHLGEEFCDIYENLFIMRKSFDKKSAENAMIKLALNGTYGNSNNEFSPFYDPKFTMSITVNGQLSIYMMVERLLSIPDLQVIAVNTDGITFKCRRKYEDKFTSLISEFENISKLMFERCDYSKMIVADVNSYTAVKLDGSLKQKGRYEWKDLPHHKNHSALIVKMAAEKFLVDGTDPEEFIRNHKDPFDFMLRTKVPRSSKLVVVDNDGVDHQTQNICRYYVSTDGGDLVKVMPPLQEFVEEQVWVNDETMEEVVISSKTDIAKYSKKGYTYSHSVQTKSDDRRFFIEAGWKCKVANDMDSFAWDVDYNYYVERTWKLINFAEDDDSSVDSEDDGAV
jgi:hypothetical protein